MTTPVLDDDLVTGAVKWLLTFDDVVENLGTLLRHPTSPSLFAHELWTSVEGTSSSAAVIAYGGSWSGANEWNTLMFPRLSLEIYVDPIRDCSKTSVTPAETWKRLFKLFKIFDSHLHRARGGDEWWGSVRTVSCSRLANPTTYPVPDGDGLLRLQAFYAVAQG